MAERIPFKRLLCCFCMVPWCQWSHAEEGPGIAAGPQENRFCLHPRKGSHRRWKHDSGAYVLLSGNAGDDAKPYQEKGVKIEIEKTQAKR